MEIPTTSSLANRSLPIALVGPFALGALVCEATASLQGEIEIIQASKKGLNFSAWFRILSKILAITTVAIFLAFTESNDWNMTPCRAFPKTVSSLASVSISFSLITFLSSLLFLPSPSKSLFLSLTALCFTSFAAMLTSSVVAWDERPNGKGSSSCSTQVERWFAIFYLLPLLLTVLPLTSLVVIQVFKKEIPFPPREASSIFTTPSQPSALQIFAEARAENRGDRDISFLKLTKNSRRDKEQSRIKLVQALVHHVVIILTLLIGTVLTFGNFFQTEEVNFAYLILSLAVVCICCWRAHDLLKPTFSNSPASSRRNSPLPPSLDLEKGIEIPPRNSSSPRPRTNSSGASRHGFSLYIPPGKALLHQFSRGSLRSARSQKDGSIRKRLFGSVSSRNPITTKLNDDTAPSTTHDSSNELNEIRDPILQIEPAIPPNIYNGKSQSLSPDLPANGSSPGNSSPNFSQGLTSRTRRIRKTSNSTSHGTYARGSSDETDRTEKVGEIDEEQDFQERQPQHHQSRPSETIQPQLTPPIESASQEGQLQAISSPIEQTRRSPSSDGGPDLSLHTAPSSLGFGSSLQSNDNLQALKKENMRREEAEVEKIMREAKIGLSINLSEEVVDDHRPAWAIAEEIRLEQINKSLVGVPIEDVEPAVLDEILDERGFPRQVKVPEPSREELFEQALSAVDEASSIEGHNSFFPQVAPSTQVSNPSSFGMNDIANNPRLKQVLDMEKPRQNPWQAAALSSSQINLTLASSKDSSNPSIRALDDGSGSDRVSPTPDQGSESLRSGKSGSGGSNSGGAVQVKGTSPHHLQHKISALSAASARTRATTVSSNASSAASSVGGIGRPVRASFDTFGRV